jgi:hypothetical protein
MVRDLRSVEELRSSWLTSGPRVVVCLCREWKNYFVYVNVGWWRDGR